jgi:hypothetical protein
MYTAMGLLVDNEVVTREQISDALLAVLKHESADVNSLEVLIHFAKDQRNQGLYQGRIVS